MSVSSSSSVKPIWQDHLNTSWASERIENVANREGVQLLYDSLLANKELVAVSVPQANVSSHSEQTTSYNYGDLEQHICSLLQAQLKLAQLSHAESTYAIVLRQRLTVLRRILYAFSSKYEIKDKIKSVSKEKTERETKIDLVGLVQERPLTGSQALLEIAVRSGLTLLFALLRQSWSYQDSSGEDHANLCGQMLTTALDIVNSLPPLSLSDCQLSTLGNETLASISRFLVLTAQPNSGATNRDQQLSSELLLALAVQRGSLCCLLEWVAMALKCSSPESIINGSFFVSTLQKMNHNLPPHDMNCSEGNVPLYKAALILMRVIVNLACDYTLNWGMCDTPYSMQSLQDNCEVYVWGSNSSRQLAEDVNEKIIIPKRASSFSNVRQVEAGQYCTFVVLSNGEVNACGKGSYGRLGLGDSKNQSTPKKVMFDNKIKKLSSSKGSDGHSLALSEDGQVYSWGDGDYGKLGHGNSTTQRQPKLIAGPLLGLKIVNISAGYRHSAAVTDDGQLYVWGEGDLGRLGLGDNRSKNIPTLVPDLSGVGSVACGSAHTLVLSSDGKTVWSFGSGEAGKLGHGDTANVYRPKIIEALQGLYIRKVAAGSQFSLALTCNGSVLVWGTSACLGSGTTDAMYVLPQTIEDLAPLHIVDITCGDSHCLALTYDCEVLAWGINAMGQCGQGHATSPVTRPRKVIGLDGVAVVTWHRPFCVDLKEATFSLLLSFLETYCQTFDSDNQPPFGSHEEHEEFAVLCLRLLCAHLSLSHMAGTEVPQIFGGQAMPLRHYLFRLVDIATPKSVSMAISECLAVGASLLLPPLRERLELLQTLLPQGSHLSKGQKLLLNVLVTSLEEHSQLSSLLNLGGITTLEGSAEIDKDYHLIDSLLKTLVNNLFSHTMEILENTETSLLKGESYETWRACIDGSSHLRDLLTHLHVHLLSRSFFILEPNKMVS
ncbi:hypothetical protein AAG570_006366 [Ranatra chinensis]|uniref:RCC1-like domain-containing protein n=1 Tax=Ranatra chinensis TaxID=642074 RepID=A0ABD0YTV8_9HEMI